MSECSSNAWVVSSQYWIIKFMKLNKSIFTPCGGFCRHRYAYDGFTFLSSGSDIEAKRSMETIPTQLHSNVITQVRILHILVLYPTDISTISHSMLGMLNGFTLDPGISDQFTDISSIRMPKCLHK